MSKHTCLSVFDLDQTLFTGNTSLAFCRYLISKRVLSPFALLYAFLCYIRHHLFGLSLPGVHTAVFSRLLKGLSLPTLQKHVTPFLEEHLLSKVYPPAFSRLRLAQHLGHYTLLLSSSPSFLVGPIGVLLGVDEWHSTEYGIDHKNKLNKILFIMEGKEKASIVEAVKKRLCLSTEQTVAYTDSIEDEPLLACAARPVAVNPDSRLRRIAKEKQWEVL